MPVLVQCFKFSLILRPYNKVRVRVTVRVRVSLLLRLFSNPKFTQPFDCKASKQGLSDVLCIGYTSNSSLTTPTSTHDDTDLTVSPGIWSSSWYFVKCRTKLNTLVKELLQSCCNHRTGNLKDDGGGGDNWSYNSCKAPVKSSQPTNQHPFFIGRMPFLSPNEQCQSTEWKKYHIL